MERRVELHGVVANTLRHRAHDTVMVPWFWPSTPLVGGHARMFVSFMCAWLTAFSWGSFLLLCNPPLGGTDVHASARALSREASTRAAMAVRVARLDK